MQPALPSTFKAQMVPSPEGADIFARSSRSGPVVVLLHGYAETSDSWAQLAAELVQNYTIVVPDLRGIGHSSRRPEGYDKMTQAADIRAIIVALGYNRVGGFSRHRHHGCLRLCGTLPGRSGAARRHGRASPWCRTLG